MELGAGVVLGLGVLGLLLIYRQQQATRTAYTAAIAKKGGASTGDYVSVGVAIAGLL